MNTIEYATEWIEKYKAGIVKKSTLHNYRYAIGYAAQVMNDTDIADVTTLDLKNAFVQLCDKGYSKSTIRIVKRVLSQTFEQAVSDGIILHNPVTRAEIPYYASEKHIDSYSDHELSTLIGAALEDIQGDPILFLLHTGLRKSELLELQWKDYNEHSHLIYIRESKTDNGIREVFLSQHAEFILRRQPKLDHGYIFSTTKGKRLSVTSLKKTCKRLRLSTGNPNITLHRCRHTFCSKLSDKGVSPKIIAELAGHSNVSFTMQRYVHPSRQQKMMAVALLDDFTSV